MNIRIATPFSHLFADPGARRAIVAASDMVELRTPAQADEVDGAVLYHCELSLVARWGVAERAELEALASRVRAGAVALEGVSFHALSRYQENELRDGAFVGLGEPYDEAALADNARRNADFARSLFGEGVALMVENNNRLWTDAYEIVARPGFLASVTRDAGLSLLWDIAHARISAHNTGVAEEAYNRALPLERALQVHLSRHGHSGERAVDAHDALADEDWDYFASHLPGLPGVRYATIEFYKDADVLLGQIERLKTIVRG